MHEAEDEAEARCYDSVMLSPRGQRGFEEHHWFQLWIPSILHIVRLSATTTSLATKDLLYTRSLLVNGAFWPFTDTSDRSWIYTVHSRTRCRGADTEVTEPPTLTSTCSRLCWLTVTQPERERERATDVAVKVGFVNCAAFDVFKLQTAWRIRHPTSKQVSYYIKRRY